MSLLHKVAFLGQPGRGKSTAGLSYPGVEQHVWGSTEETTALNFVGRTDILKPLKFDWYDTLTDEEKAKFQDEKTSELDMTIMSKKGRARNISRYRRYLYKCKDDIKNGKRPELKSLMIDNLSPLCNEFEDYVEIVWAKDFVTKDGNFDNISYYKRFKSEFTDFLREFMSIPCHTIIACHVEMVASEEISANTQFMTAAKMGGVKKEWQPMISGKTKFSLASIPDWAFFLLSEESPGQSNKYYMKLEADDSNIGVAKPRVQPYKNPRRIIFTKNKFYEEFDKALDSYIKTGVLVDNK